MESYKSASQIWLELEAKENKMAIDSKINRKYISCNSPKMIINDKSLINSELSLNIETDYFDKINIMSPLLIYNKNVFCQKKRK